MAESALEGKPADSELLLPQEIPTLNKILEAAQSNVEYPMYQEGMGAFARKKASPQPKYTLRSFLVSTPAPEQEADCVSHLPTLHLQDPISGHWS